jgi:hypothetical protein
VVVTTVALVSVGLVVDAVVVVGVTIVELVSVGVTTDVPVAAIGAVAIAVSAAVAVADSGGLLASTLSRLHPVMRMRARSITNNVRIDETPSENVRGKTRARLVR